MHSPVRSEREVFRGVVIIGVAILIAIAVGALSTVLAGLLVAAVLAAAGLALFWRGARGSIPVDVEIRPTHDRTHRILVVANETIERRELLDEIADRYRASQPGEILLVCPALAKTRLQHLASDIDDARGEAGRRLERSLVALRRQGLAAKGIVGDDDPVAATADALTYFGADELIVSTHSPKHSRWLERGAVDEIRASVDVPVTHVVEDEPAEKMAAARGRAD
jgi:GABA permease